MTVKELKYQCPKRDCPYSGCYHWDAHLGLWYHGSLWCTDAGHRSEGCPICKEVISLRNGNLDAGLETSSGLASHEERRTVFEWHEKPIKLHSGGISHFEINCESLTGKDWDAVAHYAIETFNLKFCRVIGVPRGGIPFADALRRFINARTQLTLVVDDVLTTGESILEEMAAHLFPVAGLVLVARGECPDNVFAVLQLDKGWLKEV